MTEQNVIEETAEPSTGEDDRCGENMCHCSCLELHPCGCDCPRCPDCQQLDDNCDCED
ncbi:hypothetical protein [Streptomyces sp. NBC_01264]|uniref:hypothetical protein n=1 Tax=Streptomyces sp. NBC_01264 TaxID=2903804 RepID=UPI002253AEB7|nr:hypothetical protein [Streptomyces sp. NBC_01264]MCX4778154.1 hypothetical protein [Streptomyces sp. NBC_01264]